MKRLILFLTFGLISSSASADMMFDLGFAYSGSALHKTTDKANTEYFYNTDVLFNLDNRKTWNLGWSVFGISQSTTQGTTNAVYSSMDMGPALRWNIDRAGIYSMTVAYGYLARGNYSETGATDEKWEGSSYFGQFAVQIPIYEKIHVGVSLNYYGASYSQKIVSNVQSSNDAQKTWIFPMFSLTWRQ